MNVEVQRLKQSPETAEHRATTSGIVSIDGTQICFCIENTLFIIPPGTYALKLLPSERFKRLTPFILDVPHRTAIEMHGANRAEDLDGCIGCAERRLNDYVIYEAEPATDAIEDALQSAEANGETNIITITEVFP